MKNLNIKHIFLAVAIILDHILSIITLNLLSKQDIANMQILQMCNRVKRIFFLMNEYKYEYYSQKTYSTNENTNIILDILCHE